MIDKIVGYDRDYPIYLSDIYYNEDFIGYEDKEGNIFLY